MAARLRARGSGPRDLGALLGPLPLTFLLSAVARHLAGNLFAREEAGARQDALAVLSTEPLTAGSREEIVGAAWRATSAICSATPGAQVLGVEEHRVEEHRVEEHRVEEHRVEEHRVEEHRVAEHRVDGHGRRVFVYGTTGATLPPLAWPGFPSYRSVEAEPPDLAGPALDHLRSTHGSALQWISLALPVPSGRQARWLLVGERSVAREVATAVRAVTQQATVALRARETRDELVRSARTDGLTGLLRRTGFTEAVREALPAAPAVLFCDLDGFKPVNDAFGHATGDELLRQVAHRLRRVTRPDDVCARLGGDEFAVLLPGQEGLTEEVATAVARRLVALLADPFTVEGHEIVIGASIGIALARPGDEADDLLRHADQAMYAVKFDGESGFATYAPSTVQVDGASRNRGVAAGPDQNIETARSAFTTPSP